jgi:hypothetical protein
MYKAISREDIRVATSQYVFLMKADEPVELTEGQFQAAMQFGAVPVTEDVPPAGPQERDVVEIKEDIQVAIQTILDEGGDLSMSGMPKIVQVRTLVPDATPALRDQVWATFFLPSE